MAAENLSPVEVTELMTTAEKAWNKLGPTGTRAKFTWRGKRYVVTSSQFRLMVDNEAGEPIACRYY